MLLISVCVAINNSLSVIIFLLCIFELLAAVLSLNFILVLAINTMFLFHLMINGLIVGFRTVGGLFNAVE